MLFQKALLSSKPYFLNLERNIGFELHRHPEIELHYCMEGEYDIIIDHKSYAMRPGYLAIISSLVPHALPKHANVLSLTLEIGPIFLREYFHLFSAQTYAPIYDLNNKDSIIASKHKLKSLLEETAHIHNHRATFSELNILGNIYNISATILHEFSADSIDTGSPKQDYDIIINIEKALQLIYNNYAENITLDDAAAQSGYGKSNFCKHFKNITGYSFHCFLNQYRIETACYFLRETTYPLSEIASMVGYADSKILCRVFKSIIGTTPGEYRKQISPSKR